MIPGAAERLAESLLKTLAPLKVASASAAMLVPALFCTALWFGHLEAAAPAPDKALAVAPSSVDDLDALQGTWVPVEPGPAGHRLSTDVEVAAFTFARNTLQLTYLGNPPEVWNVSLEQDGPSKRLQLQGEYADGIPRSWTYAIAGDRLTLAAVRPAAETHGGPGNPTESSRYSFKLTLIPESKSAAARPQERSRSAAETLAVQRGISVNRLTRIGQALHSCAAASGRHTLGFPSATIHAPDGTPLLSWRVAILPFLHEDTLFREFHLDEPWDSPHNRALIPKMPRLYASSAKMEPGKTYFHAVVGPVAEMRPDRSTPLFDFTDVPSNTLAVVEAGAPLEWTRPDDEMMLCDREILLPNGPYAAGIFILFADGSVRYFPSERLNTPAFKSLATRVSDQPIDSTKLF
jgi:uncharacterized protein (TIGR03067 family)